MIRWVHLNVDTEVTTILLAFTTFENDLSPSRRWLKCLASNSVARAYVRRNSVAGCCYASTFIVIFVKIPVSIRSLKVYLKQERNLLAFRALISFAPESVCFIMKCGTNRTSFLQWTGRNSARFNGCPMNTLMAADANVENPPANPG